jgi:hypothetical protein
MQVFLASFRLKRQIGKKLEALGLIATQSRLEHKLTRIKHTSIRSHMKLGVSIGCARAPNTRDQSQACDRAHPPANLLKSDVQIYLYSQ